MTVLQSQLGQCGLEMDKYTNFCNARSEQNSSLEKRQAEHQELLRLKEELAARLEKETDDVKASRLKLDEAQRVDAEAKQLGTANDEMECNVVIPGREEMARLAQKKETLAKMISQHHERSVTAEATEKKELKIKMEEKQRLSEELSVLKEELEGKKLKIQHLLRVQGESKESWESEISEHWTLGEKCRLAFEAEKAQSAEALRVRQSKNDAQIEEAKSSFEGGRDEKERYLHILL